jgi:hypothetical protein
MEDDERIRWVRFGGVLQLALEGEMEKHTCFGLLQQGGPETQLKRVHLLPAKSYFAGTVRPY